MLKTPRAGIAAATLYLLMALVVFLSHLYSVKTNPADSGESGIPFFLLTLPWMRFVPASWRYAPAWEVLAYPLAWLCILINAGVLFALFGGLATIVQWGWNCLPGGKRGR